MLLRHERILLLLVCAATAHAQEVVVAGTDRPRDRIHSELSEEFHRFAPESEAVDSMEQSFEYRELQMQYPNVYFNSGGSHGSANANFQRHHPSRRGPPVRDRTGGYAQGTAGWGKGTGQGINPIARGKGFYNGHLTPTVGRNWKGGYVAKGTGYGPGHKGYGKGGFAPSAGSLYKGKGIPASKGKGLSKGYPVKGKGGLSPSAGSFYKGQDMPGKGVAKGYYPHGYKGNVAKGKGVYKGNYGRKGKGVAKGRGKGVYKGVYKGNYYPYGGKGKGKGKGNWVDKFFGNGNGSIFSQRAPATNQPTEPPIAQPTSIPIAQPTAAPVVATPLPTPTTGTAPPTRNPTVAPTPTNATPPPTPTNATPQPTPTSATPQPTPSIATPPPTVAPTPTSGTPNPAGVAPTTAPISATPAPAATQPTLSPTIAPAPGVPTLSPTVTPTTAPFAGPTVTPTVAPTQAPVPLTAPTVSPTVAPVVAVAPTLAPTQTPTVAPIVAVVPTVSPTIAPTTEPAFFIDLLNVRESLSQWDPVIREAANRWQQVIVGDLPTEFDPLETDLFDGQFPGVAPVNLAVDDILVGYDFVDTLPTGVTGFGTPTRTRDAAPALPHAGTLEFDRATFEGWDPQNAADRNLAFQLAVHEIGHALGFGTIWVGRGTCVGDCAAGDRFYDCANANREFEAIFPGTTLQVSSEDLDGQTVCGHWEPSQYQDVGFIDLMVTVNADNKVERLTRVTVGAMEDLGYVVNYDAADPATAGAAAINQLQAEGRERNSKWQWSLQFPLAGRLVHWMFHG